MEFRDRIKELRQEKNLMIIEIADLLKKTEAAIRAWESGRTKPDIDTVIQLAEYFGCTTDYILGLTDSRYFEADRRVLKEKDGKEESEGEDWFRLVRNLPPDLRGLLCQLINDLMFGAVLPRDDPKIQMALTAVRQISDADYAALWAELDTLRCETISSD